MHPAVEAAFVPVNTPIEGSLGYMYLDSHLAPDGSPDYLVTTGMGNLIDPVETAVSLPWFHGSAKSATSYAITDTRASAVEIAYEWRRVKASGLGRVGGGNQWMRAGLFLTPDGIRDVVGARLRTNDGLLAAFFAEWPVLHPNAQLAILGMTWAMGVARLETLFPTFNACIRAGDYGQAAQACRMRPYTDPAIARRNDLHLNLLLKAVNGGSDLTWTTPDLVLLAQGKLPGMVRWGSP